MTPAEFSKVKADFIEYRQEVLLKTVSLEEKKLYENILDKFIDQLELADGKIVSNGQNIELVNAIDKIFKSFQVNGYVDIIKMFVGDMTSITAKNAEYFRILGEAQDRIPQAEKTANDRLQKQLGINEKGKLKSNGYLDKLIKDKSVSKSVKTAVYKAIAGNVDLKTLTEDLQMVIQGNDSVNGKLTQYLNNNLLDTYQAHDRISGNVFALSIGLDAFYYAGGLIGTSRCFCDKRNGNVFTRSEAQEWKSMLNDDCGPIWNEDKDGSYDPIERLGGYGCRHSVDWISDSQAIRIRPELKAVL